MDRNPTLSAITLNVDGLNLPIKRQKMKKWIKKKKFVLQVQRQCVRMAEWSKASDSKKYKENPKNGTRYLQITHLVRDLCLKNTVIKSKPTINGQSI